MPIPPASARMAAAGERGHPYFTTRARPNGFTKQRFGVQSTNPARVSRHTHLARQFSAASSLRAESVIGHFKTKVIRRLGVWWRHLEAVELATLDWVDWFIHRLN